MASTSPGTNVTFASDLDISRAPRVVFLLFFIVVSFTGNLFLVVVIVQNKKFRTVQNLLICNLCCVCIMDCVFNMSLVLGALIKNDWIYGQWMCKLNNFFMNFVSIITILTLTALSSNRYFVMRFSSKYEAWFSSYRFYLTLSYLWVHTLAFCIPFLTNIVGSKFRPQLHLCTVNGDTSLPFLYASLIACFLLPLITLIIFQIIIIRLALRRKDSHRMELAQKQYTQMTTDYPEIHRESTAPSCIEYTLLLFVSWLILHVPFGVASTVKQYNYSQEVEKMSTIEYPWEVDATFIWMRFFFPCIVPCMTYYFRKDIWQSTKECVLCRKHNSVIDMENMSRDSDVIVNKMTNLRSENASSTAKLKEKEKADTPIAFTVPVLFATSNGIHIGNTSNEFDFDSKTSPSIEEVGRLDIMGGKSLDVVCERERIEELLGDTSDYDSSCEVDPYSVSQPVSTRNVVGVLHKTRCLSNPEIPACILSESQKKEFSGTFGADSGLDLSGTAGSHVGNYIKARLNFQENQSKLDKATKTGGNVTSQNISCNIHPSLENHGINTNVRIAKYHKEKFPQCSKPHFPPRLKPISLVDVETSSVNENRRKGRRKKCQNAATLGEQTHHTEEEQSTSAPKSMSSHTSKTKDPTTPPQAMETANVYNTDD